MAPESRPALVPALATFAAALTLWLLTGVRPGEIARYVAYEAAFVAGPGVLLLGAISPGTRSWLWRICLGWPLGLVLEVAAFSITAALDVRDAFYLYPLLAGVPAALAWRHRRRPGAGGEGRGEGEGREIFGWLSFTRPQQWVFAGLAIFSFACFGMTMIALFPLQGSVQNVFYGPDTVFLISVVAEALNHWPVQEPQIAGQVLHYHYLSELHVASIVQVTGITPSVAFTRLWWIPLLALSILQAGVAGRVVGRVAWLGPVTAAMFLLVRGLELNIPLNAPFFDYHTLWLLDSPSYIYGMVFFLPLVLVVAGLLEEDYMGRIDLDGRPAAYAVLALLALGAAGAKPSLLPLAIGGLGLVVAYDLWRRRALNRTALAGAGICLAALVSFVFLLYGGTDSGGYFELIPGGLFERMQGLNTIQEALPGDGATRAIVEVVAATAGIVLLLAPSLVGLFWILGKGRAPLGRGALFMLFALLTGAASTFFLHDQSAAEVYNLQYGLVAAMPLLALGVWRALTPWAEGPAEGRRRVFAALGAWLAFCLVLAGISWHLYLDGREALGYAVVYIPVFAVFAGLLVALARTRPGARPALVAVLVLGLVLPAALDPFLDTAPDTVRKALRDEPLYVHQAHGYTPDDDRAATWIRENLDEDAILSISNQRSPLAQAIPASHTEFPAFAERRAFYEGWVYSMEAVRIGRDDVLYGRAFPYPERRDLETRVLADADPQALREMRDDYGVTHIVVDRDDGKVNPGVYRFGRIVYSNRGVEVIEL
jgi:hypothetical protein